MTDEHDSNNPSETQDSHANSQPIVTSPLTPSQREASSNSNQSSNNQGGTAEELAREFRWVEAGQLITNGILAVVGIIALIINGILALVGIIALFIYHGQLKVMSGQLTEMQESRKQAKIDNASAITAQQTIAHDSLDKSQENFDKSSRSAERAFRDEQRAWIGVYTGAIDASTSPPKVITYIKNTGKTPAFHLSQVSYSAESCCTNATSSAYRKPVFRESRSQGTLPPEGVLGGGFPIDELKPGSFVSAASRHFLHIMSGHIAYEDVFKKPHYTNYCFYVTGQLENIQSLHSDFCPYGNDTDDNPEHEPKEGTMFDYP